MIIQQKKMSTKSDNLPHYSLSMEDITKTCQVGDCWLQSKCWNTFVSCFKPLLKSSDLCDHKQRSIITTDANACLLSSWFSCRKRLRTQKALGLLWLSDSNINPNFLLFSLCFVCFQGQRKIYVVFIHNKYTQLRLQSTMTTMNPHCS